PAWTADGIVSDHWMPVSPITRELDAFRWKAPVSDMTPLIEQRTEVITAPPLSDRRNGTDVEEAAATHQPPPAPAPGERKQSPARPPAVEAVIPLVHAPADPGPPEEPAPAGNGRRRLFFR